ncbi:hypothetical protein TPHA_0D04090 [Tetrapisispora phaffii CBS 4417]|uniref:DASH complex subunit DAM1 n=1 Tax=Tetrapisispora phaffii (strain ATCC 24235 / CBS 4417 / NBRC 1672 / NRRL Y-8282 / UCD 70-5) TaxID=1071381 RepID=G8BT71_TETPH|nr:hypothetical protein TPHA_0D04090 [Tetrapisispora phaffii CBS 4417]CCE63042.1 hypothetical protein TPHA_0D04090 [Tetrapisispora phaffii CBS 4417]
MNQNKSKSVSARAPTEYKLSNSSNPSSRRTSLGKGLSESNGLYIPGDNFFNTTGRIGNESINGGTTTNMSRNIATGGTSSELDFIKEFLLPSIRSLNDSMNTLDKNFSDLNIIQENLIDFNESLSALLYGMMFNSWCVAYPSIPSDIKVELDKVNILDSITLERHELQRRIAALQNTHNNAASGDASIANNRFVQPSLTVEQVKKHNNRLQEMGYEDDRLSDDAYINELHNYDEDDEVNSEASFVLNPINNVAGHASQPHTVNSLGPSNVSSNSHKNKQRNSKLRRKSILHTIRNSIATQRNVTDARTGINDIGTSATRITGNNTRGQVRKPSNRATSRTYPADNQPKDSEAHIATRGVNRSHTDARPPFR